MRAIRRSNPQRRPAVSVIVPCYNYGRFLDDCIGSVLSQQGVDVDVLVIDDASPDGSAAVAKSWARRDGRVVALCHEVNRGHIATYNEGLSRTRGDYVVLLSADDLLTRGALARATAVMEAYPDVGLVYGHPRVFRRLDEVQESSRLTSWSVWSGRHWIAAQCRRGTSCIYSPEAVVRTSVQKAVGGYSAELPHTADLHMWLRIASVADVARVNGPDQALRRMHDASMMVTQYGRAIDDLLHRRAAYEHFFSDSGRHLSNARECLRVARRRLALDCLGAACVMHRAVGSTPEVDELVQLACSTGFPVERLHPWQELRHLRMCERSRWNSMWLRVYALMREVDARVRWRRWNHLGT